MLWTWGNPKFCAPSSRAYLTQFTRGDLDSLLMLFFDNFSSLLAILGAVLSAPRVAENFNPARQEYYDAFERMVFRKACPGIGCALLFGNIWYAWMASKVAAKENRKNVTALPYGINSAGGFLTIFMVMLPVCFKYSPSYGFSGTPEEYADKAFHAACCANFIGGWFEVSGILIGNLVRTHVPRAALFGPICGIGFVWLGFSPLIDVMREPLIGIVPLAITFTSFMASKGKGVYPRGVPMAMVIMLVGTTLWWSGLARWDTESRELNERHKMSEAVSRAAEQYVGKLDWTPFVVLQGFNDLTTRMVAIQFPIALASFLETIENVEAAELGGDSYNVNEAMLADGLGTIFGAIMGSVVPTTVYIGHRRHKLSGATSAYSLCNGIAFFILMFSGLMGLLFYIIDPVSIGCILIAVGLMIVQHAMEHSVTRHYPALLIGIMFVLADLVYFDHFNPAASLTSRSLGRMHGLSNMSPGGGIMCALVFPAILCDMTDLRFSRATVFCCIACVLSLFGLMHGNNYVFADGTEMTAVPFTTDLGEVMTSTPTYPARTAFHEPIDASDFQYKVNCAWDFLQGVWSCERKFNEGWRFCVAYAVLAAFNACHALYQRFCPDKWPALMDNGKAHIGKEELKDPDSDNMTTVASSVSSA